MDPAPLKVVTIVFKSGFVYSGVFKKFEVSTFGAKGDKVANIKWEHASEKDALLHVISLDSIDLITVQEDG